MLIKMDILYKLENLAIKVHDIRGKMCCLYNFCLEVLDIHVMALRLFLAKAFPMAYVKHLTWQEYVFNYDVVIGWYSNLSPAW